MPFTASPAPRPRRGRPAQLTAAVLLAVGLVSGCGSGTQTGTQTGTVTVTVTPTVTAAGGGPSTSVPRASTGTARSDVAGREFDLGTIVRVEKQGGVDVIVFDRWTAKGVTDADLAVRGLPMAPHAGPRFENQNSKLTYRIPVTAGATFTYRHCVALDQPVQSRSATLQDFALLAAKEKVVLLTLDAGGRVTHADNDPVC